MGSYGELFERSEQSGDILKGNGVFFPFSSHASSMYCCTAKDYPWGSQQSCICGQFVAYPVSLFSMYGGGGPRFNEGLMSCNVLLL